MLNLIQLEIFKILRRPRSFIGFAAIAIIILVIEAAMAADGKSYLDFALEQVRKSVDVSGNVLNGNLVTFIILQALIIQTPLLVALVTGDLVSGEVAAGTVRLLLTRPVPRWKIVLAKYAAGSLYTFALLVWLGLLSLGLGRLMFGNGDLAVLNTTHLAIIRADDVLWRFLAGIGIAFISLSVVSSFSIMLSCFTDNSIVPIVGSMVVILIFTIIGTMDIPAFDPIRPFLFTSHMIVWRYLFETPVVWPDIWFSMAVMGVHIVGFLLVGIWHFSKKDILA